MRAGALALRVLVAALFVVGLAISIALVDWSGILVYVAYAGVGAVLAIRRPANSIGWLLLAAGVGLALGNAQVTTSASELLAADLEPADAAIAWINAVAWGFGFVALFALTLVFPTGHVSNPRRLNIVALGAMLGMAVLITIAPTFSVTLTPSGDQLIIPNPAALLPQAGFWSAVPTTQELYPLMLAIFIGGLVGVLVRSRRAQGLERLQYRWLVASIAVVVAGTVMWVALTFVVRNYLLAQVATVVTYPAVPVAILIAVLRYRLFEIDRIISRTLAYAIVTALLALVFVAVVLGLQTVLEPFVGGGGTIAVAASTLVVAALFLPLRGRVQAIVDHRFNRARYDAQRTAAALAGQLRDETDLDAVSRDLLDAVDRALEPRSATVWLHARGGDS